MAKNEEENESDDFDEPNKGKTGKDGKYKMKLSNLIQNNKIKFNKMILKIRVLHLMNLI